MSSPFVLEITSNFPANIRKDIDTLLSVPVYTPIWQTVEWQIMLLKTGYTRKCFFVGIYEDKKLLSYALVEKRSIGLGWNGLFCIGGPIVQEDSSLKDISEALKELSLKERAVFLQIEPLQPVTLPDFTENYYKNFIEKHTALIDLGQDDETILSRMKPKGRYNIRVAEKSEVTVEQVPFSEENLAIFYDLLTETLERDAFSANSLEYFRTFLQYLEKQDLGGLFLAKREGKVIAGGIFVFYKKTALYYYGASSSDNAQRKYMASYLLQWQAIGAAKKRGCEVFDFLGIADPNDIHSPLLWVTDFKLKLTDETREWPKTQIFITRRSIYCILRIKKVLKALKNRILR